MITDFINKDIQIYMPLKNKNNKFHKHLSLSVELCSNQVEYQKI